MAWITPVTNRTSDRSRTTYSDFNRICGNLNIVEETSLKTDWTVDDIVDEDTWVTIVETCQAYDDSITYSADYINLNKIEKVALELYENPVAKLYPSSTLYPSENLYPYG